MSSKLLKRSRIVLGDESYVLSLPSTVVVGRNLPPVPEEDEEDFVDPVEMALKGNHRESQEGDDAKDAEDLQEAAQDIIRQAKQTSESIILEAYDQADTIRAKAKSDGYEEGIRRAAEEYESKLLERIAELDELRQQYLSEKHNLFASSEREMIDIVLSAMDKVFHSRAENDESVVESLVSGCINQVTRTERIVIRICETDYLQAISAKHRLLAGNERVEDLEFRVDPSLSKGSCVIETSAGVIDASVDVQLSEIKRLFDSMIE